MLRKLFYDMFKKTDVAKDSVYIKDIFTRHIDKDKVDIVFETGSHNCLDAITVNRYYNPKVIYVFECNPDCIQVSKGTLKKYRYETNIRLIENAVWSESKRIKFYPVVESYNIQMPGIKGKNIGASSCFKAIKAYNEKFIQNEIEVDAIRLDDFCRENNISKIDLMCMDLQGAEYYALMGLGDMIRQVRYIITEIITKSLYDGQHYFDSVNRYLEKNNFKLVEHFMECDVFGNFLYINQSFK